MAKRKFNWRAALTTLATFLVVGFGLLNIGAAKDFVIRVVGPGSTYGSYVKFYDEDTMSSNDAAGLASQQSIKAYADTLLSGGAQSPTFTNLDVTGTLNADTLDVDGASDFDGAMSADTVTITVTLDVTGTANADTLDVDGDADFAQTLNADTLDVDGAVDIGSTITIHAGITMAGGTASSGGNVPYTVNIDTGTSVDDGTTAKMISQWGFSVDELVAGDVLRIDCSGTGSGANDTKTLYLLCGTTATTGIVQTAAATNATWHLQMNVAVVSDTSQKVWGSWVSDGATIAQTTYEAWDCGIASGETISLYVDLANTGDVVQKEVCIWELLP